MLALAVSVFAVVAFPVAPASTAAAKEEKLEGYAEWRTGETLLVDGQRVRLAPGARLKLNGEARDWASIPLGYEVEALGTRSAEGSLVATEVEVKPNGAALFEGLVKSATDEAEEKYRRAGQFFQEADGRREVIGRLRSSGPRVERAREVVDRLVPPYVRPEDVRVYVVENKDWNAMAMGNFSVYVYSGLMDETDDDELAIVLGHEIAHATHEHTRRHFKKEMWVQLAALGVAAAAEEIDGRTKRVAAGLLAQLGAVAWSNGHGRDLEDQADRVGLRYAYEGGFDVTRGPHLWERFARKYGDGNKVVNFFFSDHSRASARATDLQREIALNYPGGPRMDRPAVARRTPAPRSEEERAAMARQGAKVPAQSRVESAGTALLEGTASSRVRVGMTKAEVRAVLGDPVEEVVFAPRSRWSYPDLTVIFEDGRVKEVRF